MDELGTGGHVEEHFAADVHAFVLGGEEDFADLFADVCAAGLAELADLDVGGFEFGDEGFHLRGFAAAVGAVEDDEFAGEMLEVVCGHEGSMRKEVVPLQGVTIVRVC